MNKLIIFSLLLSVFTLVVILVIFFSNFVMIPASMPNEIIMEDINYIIAASDDILGAQSNTSGPTDLKDRIEKLEKDILLLKEYIDVNSDYVLSISSINREITMIKTNLGNISAFNKYFFAILLTLSLSVVGLNIAVIRKL